MQKDIGSIAGMLMEAEPQPMVNIPQPSLELTLQETFTQAQTA